MAKKLGLVVGIEVYKDRGFRKVSYAEADAREFKLAVERLGVEIADDMVLINDDATKARMDARLQKFVDRASKGDTLMFFFAGHGFSEAGKNYLVCYDTDSGGACPRTSLPLQDVFEFVRTSDAKRVVMFIDACHSGMPTADRDRNIMRDMSSDEIEDFFGKSEFQVCFAACKEKQKSHHTAALKHGVWTYHLLRAFNGEDKDAVEVDTKITSRSLQNYLAKHVPRTIKKVFTDIKDQTPVLYGQMTQEFEVVDIAAVVAERARKADPIGRQVRRLAFIADERARVKELSGFEKRFHQVPDKANNATNAFVARIAQEELKAAIDDVYERMRTHLGYKRKELDPPGIDGSYATVLGPDFSYTVGVTLLPEDPSVVVWEHRLENITDAVLLESDEFAACFPDTFSRIEVRFDRPLDIEGIIDAIEDLDDNGVSVNYPSDNSRCEISIEGVAYDVVASGDTVTLSFRSGAAPADLLAAVVESQKLLIEKHGVTLLLA